MTTLSLEKIGLVAHFSRQGDWAFNIAFSLARANDIQLNILCFSETSYTKPFNNIGRTSEEEPVDDHKYINEEFTFREYYDEALGDYDKVGFRLCRKFRHNFELSSCLAHKDFQLIVIPYINRQMMMDDLHIEQFIADFSAPAILVGPDRKDQFLLNSPATLLVNSGLPIPRNYRDMQNIIEKSTTGRQPGL